MTSEPWFDQKQVLPGAQPSDCDRQVATPRFAGIRTTLRLAPRNALKTNIADPNSDAPKIARTHSLQSGRRHLLPGSAPRLFADDGEPGLRNWLGCLLSAW